MRHPDCHVWRLCQPTRCTPALRVRRMSGMRAIWKGAISFGLVNVPVKVYSATEDHDVSLHQVHDEDGGRIRYQRRCEICGKVVDYEHIDKAYDDGEQHRGAHRRRPHGAAGRAQPGDRGRRVRADRADRPDHVRPELLPRAGQRRSRRTCCCAAPWRRPTARRSCSSRCGRRPGSRRCGSRGKVLMLQTLLWDDEVREADFPVLDEDVRISAQELEMSRRWSTAFRPTSPRTSSPTTTRSSCAR